MEGYYRRWTYDKGYDESYWLGEKNSFDRDDWKPWIDVRNAMQYIVPQQRRTKKGKGSQLWNEYPYGDWDHFNQLAGNLSLFLSWTEEF